MNVSEVFFRKLWDQLLKDQDKSFLARFLRDERVEKRFSEATLDNLLKILADPNKNLQIGESLEKECLEWLDRLRGHAPDVLPPDRTGIKAQYKQLQQHPEVVSESELESLREIVTKAVSVQTAWDFLDNSGFGRKKETVKDEVTGENTVRTTIKPISRDENENKIRKKNSMLRILDKWCRETDYTLVPADGTGDLTDEERAAWKEMFRLLQGKEGKERNDLIFPIKIDPSTGVGLYMIGLGLFENEQLVTDLQSISEGDSLNYIFVCFGPMFFNDRTEEYEKKRKAVEIREKSVKIKEINRKIRNGTYIDMSLLSQSDETDTPYCVTFEQGEIMFSSIRHDEDLSYTPFRDVNGPPPPGTPELLHRYFDLEEADLQVLANKGKEEYQKDIKTATREPQNT